MKLLSAHNPDQLFRDSGSRLYTNCLKSDSSADWARESATQMLNLLPRLETEIDDDGTWYGFTSHHALCLNRTPTTNSPLMLWISPTSGGRALAKVNGLPKEDAGCFYIGYRFPDSESPWPDAKVQMYAESVTECLAAIKVALKNCE